jgi:hypothetical protein
VLDEDKGEVRVNMKMGWKSKTGEMEEGDEGRTG